MDHLVDHFVDQLVDQLVLAEQVEVGHADVLYSVSYLVVVPVKSLANSSWRMQ